MIQRYRKRPVVIDAVWYDGTNKNELVEWGVKIRSTGDNGDLILSTIEDGQFAQVEHVASPGDYIIRGVKGEFYPCKPQIFQATYEYWASTSWATWPVNNPVYLPNSDRIA